MTREFKDLSMLHPSELVKRLIATILMVTMTACGTSVPKSGVEAQYIAKHKKVLVVPLMTNDLRSIQHAFSKTEEELIKDVGWDIPGTASKITSELLMPHGGSAVNISYQYKGDAVADKLDERVTGIWRELGPVIARHDAEVVLVFEQNAVDVMGRQYNPVGDYFAMGLVGLIHGAATKDTRFSPAMTFAFMSGSNRSLIGPSRCSVGFDARLIDARDGKIIGQANQVLGQEYLPDDAVKSEKWSEMSEKEKSTVREYCLAALRRGVSQALVDVGLMQ
jgi:uncharacterized lipoprotein YehR (DUF1307 family)